MTLQTMACSPDAKVGPRGNLLTIVAGAPFAVPDAAGLQHQHQGWAHEVQCHSEVAVAVMSEGAGFQLGRQLCLVEQQREASRAEVSQGGSEHILCTSAPSQHSVSP